MTPLDQLGRAADDSAVGRVSAKLATRMLSAGEVLALTVGFLALVPVVALSLYGLNLAAFGGALDVPVTWPISVFSVHTVWEPRWLFVLVLVGSPALFVGLAAVVARTDGLVPVGAAGLALVLATTLLQGPDAGFVAPVAGGYVMDYGAPGPTSGIQYYHDAIAIADPLRFLASYADLQPTLNPHSRTHPPGAVLTFYALSRLFPPALITVVVAVVAVALSAPAVFALCARVANRTTARYATFLYLLLPSVQVYYAASLDALVAALVVAGVASFVVREDALGALGAAVCLLAASFLTFTAVFAVPLLAAYELTARRRLRRTAAVVGVVALAYAALAAETGFDYVESARVALAVEHAKSTGGVVGAVNYLVTRAEAVAEVVLFFTPYLTWLAVRERRRLAAHLRAAVSGSPFGRPALVLFPAAVLTLLGMLVAGLYYTGETARAALFVYPFLLLPLAAYLDDLRPTGREQFVLAGLVFAQTVAMQVVGFYFW